MGDLIRAEDFAQLRIDRRVFEISERRSDVETAAKAVGVVMAAYRAGLFTDAKSYLKLACAALEEFSPMILADMANPRIGIIRECVFPPSIAELVRWCEKRRDERLFKDGHWVGQDEFLEFWKAYCDGERWAVGLHAKLERLRARK